MSLVNDAHDAIDSDFFVAVGTYDRNVLIKFVNTSWFPFTTEEAWLRNLPPYVIKDVERAIRNVKFTNQRMTQDLTAPIAKHYHGRANISHRKARV